MVSPRPTPCMGPFLIPIRAASSKCELYLVMALSSPEKLATVLILLMISVAASYVYCQYMTTVKSYQWRNSQHNESHLPSLNKPSNETTNKGSKMLNQGTDFLTNTF